MKLPTVPGVYEVPDMPVPEYDPYVLKDGKWYEMNEDGWHHVKNPKKHFKYSMPVRMVTEGGVAE